MAHSRHHKDLLTGLALGILSDAEVEKAAALLETCPECKDDLERYRKGLAPDLDEGDIVQPIPITAGKPRQLAWAISGPQQAVSRELQAIKDLIGDRYDIGFRRASLKAAASGSVQEAVAILGNADSDTQLIDLVREYLVQRESDPARSGVTQLTATIQLQYDQDTKTVGVRKRQRDATADLDHRLLENLITDGFEFDE